MSQQTYDGAGASKPLLNTNNPFRSTQDDEVERHQRSRRGAPNAEMDARAILASTSGYNQFSRSNDYDNHKKSSSRHTSRPGSSKQAHSSVMDCGPSGPSSSPRTFRHSASNSVENAKSRSGRQRASSLTQRHPGDMSHRPLDIIKAETKAANRSPHLKRSHIPGADLIDSLDDSMGQLYHHEGPYDATLKARNNYTKNEKFSPVEAVRWSNEEALKATPRELVRDALEKHVPLQGTAAIPPGRREMSGEVMRYEEGDDLMRDADAPGGAYRRWSDVKYLPEDLKGKGEPSYTFEESLKQKERLRAANRSDHKSRRRGLSEANNEIELQNRSNYLSPVSPARPNPTRSTSAQYIRGGYNMSGGNMDDGKGKGATTTTATATDIDEFYGIGGGGGIEGTAAASSEVRRRQRSSSNAGSSAGNSMNYTQYENDMRRSNTTGKLGGLKRRIGSLRRSRKGEIEGVAT